MNKWTHAICMDCWMTKHPDRGPVKARDKVQETCCYCGRATLDGIYVRANPFETPCFGLHEATRPV